MSWNHNRGQPEPAGGGQRRGLSITARLALLFTVSAFAILGLVTAVLCWAVIQNLEKDDLQFLQDRVQWLRAALRNFHNEPRLLVREIQAESGATVGETKSIFYVRVLDESGKILAETPGMGELLPASFFPFPVAIDQMPEQMLRREVSDGRLYFLVSARAATGGESPAARVVQVALDDTLETTMLADYRLIAITLLVLGTLLFAAIGVIIALHAMRPLREIARTAERITATQLNQRVQATHWPEELATLAESFDRMLTGLEESFTRLTRLSADLAHELRTPIHNLMGQTEIALSRERTAEDYRETLQSNLEELGRLARMVNGLLFLARADNPRTHIERARLDARSELEAVREFHEALAEEMGISIVCEGEAQIVADPTLLRRAITNLVSNALRHTGRGGEVLMSVKQERDGGATVSVCDNGCGIGPEHLPRVFDRFYRAGRPNPDHPEGAGLGLAIVDSILVLHGGSATIESAPGKGTKAELRFPGPAESELRTYPGVAHARSTTGARR